MLPRLIEELKVLDICVEEPTFLVVTPSNQQQSRGITWDGDSIKLPFTRSEFNSNFRDTIFNMPFVTSPRRGSFNINSDFS